MQSPMLDLGILALISFIGCAYYFYALAISGRILTRPFRQELMSFGRLLVYTLLVGTLFLAVILLVLIGLTFVDSIGVMLAPLTFCIVLALVIVFQIPYIGDVSNAYIGRPHRGTLPMLLLPFLIIWAAYSKFIWYLFFLASNNNAVSTALAWLAGFVISVGTIAIIAWVARFWHSR